MTPFKVVTGRVAPLDRANVDTDQIIPKQFLKSIRRTGFGDNLFDAWRYLDEGSPEKDAAEREINPDFVLNQPRYRGAEILLARENFGCGSSREHAVWALAEYGFRCVIAPSFADIFASNCFKNGVLPIALQAEAVEALFQAVFAADDYHLTVDLPAQAIRTPQGRSLAFEVDSFRKECLVEGLDDIGVTLEDAAAIRSYETRRREEAPWLFETLR